MLVIKYRHSFQVRLVLALLCGTAMPFAFSPYDFKWIASIALAIWLATLLRGQAFWMGLAFGFGWFGLGSWWLADTLHTFAPMPYGLALMVMLPMGFVMGCFPAIWAWLCVRFQHRIPILYLFPALAVLIEWLRGFVFTGLPWTSLGTLILDTPAVGWALWVGVYGAAFIPALLACCVYFLVMWFQRGGKKWRVEACCVLAFSCVVLIGSPDAHKPEGERYRVALVQPNIAQDQKWDATFLEQSLQRLISLSAEYVADVDLVVWPESAVPFYPKEALSWDAWLRSEMEPWQKPVIFGGLSQVGTISYNGAYLQKPDVPVRDFVGKQHLVPFGEYVPDWVPFLKKMVQTIGNFQPYEGSVTFQYKDVLYGPLICYESLFPELTRKRVLAGAQVLVNVTNDAWYGDSPAAWQHLQAIRMRAVESGRYVLRAANTGVTGIISPDGSMNHIPWFTAGVFVGEFQLSDRITPYQRFGNWLLLLLLIPIFWFMFYAFRQHDA
ncbi:MAG: apolipoprotein N-acyltransferase [Mariprofundaceae bacterium]|nr:apolipoprotein N-acyltransferase [Mariprofundaceae bacterium]